MLLYAMHCCISEYATYIYIYVLSYISVYHICHLYSTTCCCMLLDRILYDYILSFYIITFLNIIIHCPILYEYTLVSVISYHEIISYIYIYMETCPVDCDLSISWTESSSLGPAISWDPKINEIKMQQKPKTQIPKWKFLMVQTLHI